MYGQYLPYTSLSIYNHKLVLSPQYLLGMNAGCTDSTCPTLAFLYTNTNWYCHLSICWVGKNAGCTDSTCPTLAFLYTNTSWFCHTRKCCIQGRKEMFYLTRHSIHFNTLYGVGHMVKDHSYSEKGNPLPPLPQ